MASTNDFNMSLSEVQECCKDEECRKFVASHLPRQTVSDASRVGAGKTDWLSFVMDNIPVLLDLIRRWREGRNPVEGSSGSGSTSSQKGWPKEEGEDKE